jgi:2,4-dienoyl-CoA reductase-like NADH-dependent reductase (Old Yellow Enzyme family)
VTASSGGAAPEQRLNVYPGYQVPHAERIRRETGMCTMAVGLITEPRQAEDILASGNADLVALGRGILYNPRWPWHAAAELGEDVSFPKQYARSHPSMRSGDFLKPAQ